MGFDLTYVLGPMEGAGRVPPPLSSVSRGSRTYGEARGRWLIKPTRTTRQDWPEPVRLCSAAALKSADFLSLELAAQLLDFYAFFCAPVSMRYQQIVWCE